MTKMLGFVVSVALGLYTLYVVGCAYEEWDAAGRPTLEELP